MYSELPLPSLLANSNFISLECTATVFLSVPCLTSQQIHDCPGTVDGRHESSRGCMIEVDNGGIPHTHPHPTVFDHHIVNMLTRR